MSLNFTGPRNVADEPADILVNTVNTVGVMGKGVALAMKERFPEILPSYQHACKEGRLHPGTMHLAKTNDGRRVVNLATKQDWRDPSRPEWVGSGLFYLNLWLTRQKEMPRSLSLPMPGAGNGGLDPARVQRMVRSFLAPAIWRGLEVNLLADEEPQEPGMVFFAGVGARDTPKEIQHVMSEAAALASDEGWTLRSGGAIGADSAFHRGSLRAAGDAEIFLHKRDPKIPEGVVETRDVHFRTVKNFHPKPDALGRDAAGLMARNACQVFGAEFSSPSAAVVCWTPGGKAGGGTGQAIRLARAASIPVIDLGAPEYRGITADSLMGEMREKAEEFHADRDLKMPESLGKSALEMMGL